MPPAHVSAAIVSVGDELTLGQTLDTNARWLSDQLVTLGILPVEHVTVPDDLAAQVRVLRRLASSVDLILVTGGLGPTADDLTRRALAHAMDDTLVEDTIALAQVEAFFAARGREVGTLNRAQALRPSRGAILSNLHGTAPGLVGVVCGSGQGAERAAGVVEHAADVFCLPGPPKEMFPMFEHQVVPRLKVPVGRTVRTRVLRTFGLGESDIAARLGALMDRDATPLVGTTASAGVVSVRLRYAGSLQAMEAEVLLDATERTVRDAIGEFVFGTGSHTLADAVVWALARRRETLCTVESCTGGLLGGMVTGVPGSSACYVGGLVTYSDELKQRFAGVPAEMFGSTGAGAVSPEVAIAMAKGGLAALHTDHALAITGIAGPGGATGGKPVGTVFIALASNAGEPEVRRFAMIGDRASIRDWSAKAALAMLWQRVGDGRATANGERVVLIREVAISP